MAVNSIDNNLITQFSERVHHEAQQNISRFRPHVILKPLTGDEFAYDGLGTVEARKITARVTPATFDDIEHRRRQIQRERYVVNLPIDRSDVRGLLMDPRGAYAQAAASSIFRSFDRVGAEQSFADVKTGRSFGTTVTFAADGGKTVDATSGLTYEKLLEVNKNFRNEEAGISQGQGRVLAITGDEEEQLMKEIELISGDYTRRFVVERGEITEAVGMTLLIYGADVPNPILSVASTTRDNIAFTTMGLCYGISKEMEIKVQERSDFIETDQVQVITEIGAVRTEGVQIQKVQTTTS